MNNVREYIEEYKKLEEAVRRVYHLSNSESIITILKNRYKGLEKSIQTCADLRNFCQHGGTIDNKYVVDVSIDAIEFVKELTKMVNKRLRCRDICIKYSQVYWRTMDDSVKETMIMMKNNLYTHIPIIENNKVIGVFDENSLFDYLVNNDDEIFEFDNTITFQDMKEYLNITGREMETFEFYSMNKYVDELTDIFEKRVSEGKRIGLVLLTNHGNKNEELQGILTPWDLVNKV